MSTANNGDSGKGNSNVVTTEFMRKNILGPFEIFTELVREHNDGGFELIGKEIGGVLHLLVTGAYIETVMFATFGFGLPQFDTATLTDALNEWQSNHTKK
jgi:hypothetical protein